MFIIVGLAIIAIALIEGGLPAGPLGAVLGNGDYGQ
jgi:hypothetical protein